MTVGAGTVEGMETRTLGHDPLEGATRDSRWGWPPSVDATTARLVAAVTVATATTAWATTTVWLVWALAASFTVRALAGPRLDPLASAASMVARTFTPARPTPAAPKRLAATMGAVMSTTAAAMATAQLTAAWWVLAALTAAAFLEAAFGWCAACQLHRLVARTGAVDDCADCADDCEITRP
jgi:hypothetical protein